MSTKNYELTGAGILVASGIGNATVTPRENCYWLISNSNSVAPTKSVKHRMLAKQDRSMALLSGEYLWLYGEGNVAVTATVPAAGDF